MKENDIFEEVFQKYKNLITDNFLNYKYINKFTSKKTPTINEYDYFNRIFRYSKVPNSILPAGYIYAKRCFYN